MFFIKGLFYSMESLASLLKVKGVVSSEGQNNAKVDDKTIFFVFYKIIQEEFGRLGRDNFEADYFGNKKIFIKSKSSAWASHLWLEKERIARKINEELGGEFVLELKMK